MFVAGDPGGHGSSNGPGGLGRGEGQTGPHSTCYCATGPGELVNICQGNNETNTGLSSLDASCLWLLQHPAVIKQSRF